MLRPMSDVFVYAPNKPRFFAQNVDIQKVESNCKIVLFWSKTDSDEIQKITRGEDVHTESESDQAKTPTRYHIHN